MGADPGRNSTARPCWHTCRMRITALSGGVGGARFLRGLRHYLAQSADSELATAELTIIGNTGDDITMFGLRICPDLDTLLYTLADAIHEGQGWGRADESYLLQAELAAYGCQPQWFQLGDRDLALHIARTELLHQGVPLSAATYTLGQRWSLAEQRITLLPMSDDPIETQVRLAAPESRTIHFQEWWIRYQARLPAVEFIPRGAEHAHPGPGVLAAIAEADLVLLPPSNPIVSIGIILAVPGIRAALQECTAPVVGISPIVHGRPVRGHADQCLQALGLPTSSAAVAELYADFLDLWLVAPGDDPHAGPKTRVAERPLLMTDARTTAALAAAAVELGRQLSNPALAQ